MAIEFYNRNWRVPNSWNGTEDNNSKVSNYSMNFDGSSEYVNLGDSDTLSFGNGSRDSAFSFFIWAKFGNITTNCFMSKQTTGTSNSEYAFTQSGDTIETTFAEGVGTRTGFLVSSTTVSPSLTTGQWYHIGFTYAGGRNPSTGCIIYVNGVAQTMSYNISSYTAMSNNSAPVKIGELSGASPTYNFNGELDHSCFFDYELTQAQVTELYGSSSTGVGNPMAITNGRKPIAYYPLGDYSAYNGTEYLVPNSALSDYVFNFTSNGKISTGNITSLNNVSNASYSFWFYPTSSSGNIGFLGGQSAAITAYFFSSVFYIHNLGTGFISTSIPALNQWHHVCCTFDVGSTEAFLNGVSVGTNTNGSTTTNPNGANDFEIGRANNFNFYFNSGQISNVALFNTTLPATGTESVASLYNNGTPPDISSYSGLQGWWKLDAGSTFDGSNWNIPDESSNSNDGTSSGMTAANLVQSTLNILSPYSRYALSFDGSSDYIDCGANENILDFSGNDYTVSTWVNWEGTGDANQMIASVKSGGSNVDFVLSIQQSTGRIIYWNGYTQVFSNSAIPTGTWCLVTVIVKSGQKDFFINGVADGTPSQTRVASATSGTTFLIGKSNHGSEHFNGSISNVSIWNAALTSAQITEIYNDRSPSNLNNHSAYSNLVSWWTLGENSSFNSNWTVLNEISTKPNGLSAGMAEDDLVSGVGQTASGVSSGMGGADNINGDAPYSNSNALSYGMGVDAKSTSVPT